MTSPRLQPTASESRRSSQKTQPPAEDRARSRREYPTADLRTIALVGHRSCGKTSLGEMLLQAGGVTRAMGRVGQGTALLDATPSERKRGMSLVPSFAWFGWADRLVNLVDTPGSDAVAHCRRLAAMGADTTVAVIDCAEGVQLGAEQALADAHALGTPRFAVITKIDRSDRCFEVEVALAALPGVVPVPLTLLHREGDRVTGVVSLLDGLLHPRGREDEAAPPPVPVTGHEAELAAAWERLSEAVAVTDDRLLELYLELLELPKQEVLAGLARAVRAGRLCPVLHCSPEIVVGARPLLDALALLGASPADREIPAWEADGGQVTVRPDGPFVAQWLSTQLDEEREPYHVLRVWSGAPPKSGVWTNGASGEPARVRKLYQIRGPRRATASCVGPGAIVATWDPLVGVPGDCFTAGERWVLRSPEIPAPMVAGWIGPATATGQKAPPKSAEARRFDEVLGRLCAMDPSIAIAPERVDGGCVVHADSELQLSWLVERAAEWFDVPLVRAPAPVPYRELPAAMVTDVPGVHRKDDNTGTPVEFGEVHVDLWGIDAQGPVPLEVAVESALTGDEIPAKFHDAVLEGVYRGLERGPRGYPVAGAVARVVGGEYDILESTADHFRIAGELAAKAALERAGTRLLEPWVEIVVWAAPDVSGHVLAEVASRRGRVLGMEVAGEYAALYAIVPYRELRSFAPALLSLTNGRGRYQPGEWHWELLPANLDP